MTQKQKSRTPKSPLMQDWVFRPGSLMMGDGDSCWLVEEHFSDKTGKKVLLPEYIKIIPGLAPSFLDSPRDIRIECSKQFK